MRLSYVNNLLIVCTGISPAANIFRLATASRASVALRRKCEPIFVVQAPRVDSRAERVSKKEEGATKLLLSKYGNFAYGEYFCSRLL